MWGDFDFLGMVIGFVDVVWVIIYDCYCGGVCDGDDFV